MQQQHNPCLKEEVFCLRADTAAVQCALMAKRCCPSDPCDPFFLPSFLSLSRPSEEEEEEEKISCTHVRLGSIIS